MKKTLWTKDFSLITVSTILSIIGGEAMMFPLSLLVFEKTQSTFLSAIMLISGFLPDVLLTMFISPFVDRGNKKRWIIGLDIVFFIIYVLMAFWLRNNDFNYGVFLGFSLLTASLSIIYRLNFDAWYPDLIEKGLEQKGFAIGNTIWPVIGMIMAPISAALYKLIGMSNIFFFVSALLVMSIILESQIKFVKTEQKQINGFREYVNELKDGIAYFKKEKGLRNIYSYMSITNGTSYGMGLMEQAYFQSTASFTVVMLGFLKLAELLGRSIGGFIQYKVEIPPKKRFIFTKFVYTIYNLVDAVILFLPYPLMLALRFICGSLGVSSATIRETAVQSYIPREYRARINAVFTVMFSTGMLIFQLLAGIIGEYIPYRTVMVIFSVITLIAIYFLIAKPKEENRKIYEAVRKEENIDIENISVEA